MADRPHYTTPGTRICYATLEGWIIAAHKISARRLSRHRNRALKAHGCTLPRAVIKAATDIAQIDYALHLLKYGPPPLCRPQRGERAEAGQTQVIMDLMNRRRALERMQDLPCPGHNRAAALSGPCASATTKTRTQERSPT